MEQKQEPKKSLIPSNKPKLWVVGVYSWMIGIAAFLIGGGARWARKSFEGQGFCAEYCVPSLKAVEHIAGGIFFMCVLVGLLACWFFTFRIFMGKYNNLSAKPWKDQVW